ERRVAAGQHHEASQYGVEDPLRSSRARVANRMRERRKSPARACCRTAEGVCSALGARRVAIQTRAADDDRESLAVDRRRCARVLLCFVDCAAAFTRRARDCATHERRAAQRQSAPLQYRCLIIHRITLWCIACAAFVSNKLTGDAERQ